ncbi:hypothetical protein [Macrococcoides caseolyticum]|uniref:hypothetical protein n=1 Tax=Macrococcoides caseolyticum TaxID=69966 RepID=UPI000C33B4F8|nr:hypothetical protein [Macrococcus caseolyticus]PKE16169.1 hypothetical protein CW718_10965 [Macrococcus caseolyticus]PKE48023.1 hypothetical protein CW672_11050 [Macrococcus caseolyticus]PKE52082.1 hypothetical protein CW676_11305 [Macrococcus caseolyticus]PKF05114.1 hypothetical protein CW698_10960 [Macrococcus caseolyticus]PKF28758.1 hypothetical protein CW697_11750 [Macrococcus caseolyticus]
MNNNLITVVALADKLQVAKQTIFYNAKRLNLELTKHDNVSYVTLEQAEQITQRINSNKSSKRDNNTSHSRDNDGPMTQSNDMLNILLEQLRVKDEQIKQLNNTLDEQQRLLSQQQSLQLQSNEKIKALEIELQEVKETTAEDNTTDIKAHSDNKGDNFYKDLRNDRESENKGFLSKLFKR